MYLSLSPTKEGLVCLCELVVVVVDGGGRDFR